MGYSRVTPASVHPVTRDEVKLAQRIDTSADDTLIDAYIGAAVSHIELTSGRLMCQQTWKLTLDSFPVYADVYRAIEFRRAPIQSISEIAYLDEGGNAQTWASDQWLLDTTKPLARLSPAYQKFWPITLPQINAVSITFLAGYPPVGSPADYRANVPEDLKVLVKLMVGTLYENREREVLGTTFQALPYYDAMIAPYRVASHAI